MADYDIASAIACQNNMIKDIISRFDYIIENLTIIFKAGVARTSRLLQFKLKMFLVVQFRIKLF